MKRIATWAAAISFFSFSASAAVQKTSDGGFFFNPFLSIEYAAPQMSSGGTNADFSTFSLGDQLKDFQNIAVGGNFRVHKFLGFNINWVQTGMDNTSLQNHSISTKAKFKMDQYSVSALFYAPKVELVEFFGEIGVSDMTSKLTFVDTSGVAFNRKDHETRAFVGLGLQLLAFDNGDAIRLTFQRHLGKLALLDTNYNAVRLGYLKSF